MSLTERSFDEDDEPAKETEANGSKSEKPQSISFPDSELPESIQAVCSLIFNQSIVNAALSEMNYDANKLPLGSFIPRRVQHPADVS